MMPTSLLVIVVLVCISYIPLITVVHGQRVAWNVSVPWATTFGDPYLYETRWVTPRGNTTTTWTVVVFASSSNASALVALDADTGALLWSIMPEQIPVAPYSGWCDGLAVASQQHRQWSRMSNDDHSRGISSTKMLYCGLDDGIIAVNGATGDILWRHRVDGMAPNAAAPAHPTAVPAPSSDFLCNLGFVVFTFENGVNSSFLYAVRADNGSLITLTQGERVFTKIWSVASTIKNSIALCSINEDNIISVSVRTLVEQTTQQPTGGAPAALLQIRWNISGLPYSPPGLWDNPNLDVDAGGQTIFMYQKEHIGVRSVTQYNSSTGKLLWNLPTTGHVVDYDTFAFQGNFYRLVTTNDHTGNGVTVEAYNNSAGGGGMQFMDVHTPCNDSNAILLVGGPLGAPSATIFVVGLNTGTLWYVDENALQWSRSGLDGISTAVVGPTGETVIFGVGGTSSLLCLRLR